MLPAIPPFASAPRASRVIAEALVKRHGPRRIVHRATRLGLPLPLTQAMVVACSAAAIEPMPAPRRSSALAP